MGAGVHRLLPFFMPWGRAGKGRLCYNGITAHSQDGTDEGKMLERDREVRQSQCGILLSRRLSV